MDDLSRRLGRRPGHAITEMAMRMTEDAIRTLGGAGLIADFPVPRQHRDALLYVISDGTSDVLRNIVAEGLGFDPRP